MKMSPLQIGILVVFVVAGLLAVLMFAGIVPTPGSSNANGLSSEAEIVMWGPFDGHRVADLFEEFNSENEGTLNIKYVGKNPETYESEIVNALAAGVGPDIWIINQKTLLDAKNKLYLIPFESYPEKNLIATFVDTGNVFLDRTAGGTWGLPFLVDPLVLYWNRDLFSSASISDYPRYWNEFIADVASLTIKDGAGNITRSGTAMGEYKNVNNAKGILSMLIMQSGNPIVESNPYSVVLNDAGTSVVGTPAENSLKFFNEFSNVGRDSYSWNRSLADSDFAFANSKLAMYFGYASELVELTEKNPHLNLGVSGVPQQKNGEIRATYGDIYALAISKNSRKLQASFVALFKLADAGFNRDFAEAFDLAPARRDVLSEGTEDLVTSTIYSSAIMAKTWVEPNPQSVDEIFKNMIESTVVGKSRVSAAVREATLRLKGLFK